MERWTRRNYAHLPMHDQFVSEYGLLLGSYLASRGFKDLEEVQRFFACKISEFFDVVFPRYECFKVCTKSMEKSLNFEKFISEKDYIQKF